MRIAVRVKPGSSRTAVGGRYESPGRAPALVVRISARAVDGAATEATLVAVAKAFGLRRRDVELVSGATSRDKVLQMAVDDADVARRRWADLLET